MSDTDPAHIADTDRHDEGVRCISLDGHHRLQRTRWAWDCSVCGAVLRLSVWYPREEDALRIAVKAIRTAQYDGSERPD